MQTPLTFSQITSMASAFDWLAQNPALAAGLIAGVVALSVGLLTFTGVLLSNSHAMKRQVRQLQHDAMQSLRNREHASRQADLNREHAADQARIERLTTLRREVYLTAVPELVKAQGFLARLSKVDITDLAQLSPLEGLAIAASKISVVGSQPTALKARRLSSRYGETFLKGVGLLKSVPSLNANIRLYQNLYDQSQSEINRILSSITQLNETNTCTPEIAEGLNRSFGIQIENSKKHSTALTQAIQENNKIGLNYSKELLNELSQTSHEVDELLCLIRGELGLPTDLAEFRTQSAEAQDRIRTVLIGLGVGFEAVAPKPLPSASDPVEAQRPDLQPSL
ncbi:hypothetical protein [Hydrogenophaga sp. RWCD_12]|uniref:hypothetical protein n=1 Tax=Hydrogenophaga sp. RWCD_12 TaxID=3391190 RepID=UPI003984EC08